jgi:aerobic-type carbon monoxide dehydrogenase small subunit (CoxS/CutS family)
VRLLHGGLSQRGPGAARAPAIGADPAQLERTILEALDGHICRCTGYVRYHQAERLGQDEGLHGFEMVAGPGVPGP